MAAAPSLVITVASSLVVPSLVIAVASSLVVPSLVVAVASSLVIPSLQATANPSSFAIAAVPVKGRLDFLQFGRLLDVEPSQQHSIEFTEEPWLATARKSLMGPKDLSVQTMT